MASIYIDWFRTWEFLLTCYRYFCPVVDPWHLLHSTKTNVTRSNHWTLIRSLVPARESMNKSCELFIFRTLALLLFASPSGKAPFVNRLPRNIGPYTMTKQDWTPLRSLVIWIVMGSLVCHFFLQTSCLDRNTTFCTMRGKGSEAGIYKWITLPNKADFLC